MMSSVAHFTCRGPLSGQPGQGNLIWMKGGQALTPLMTTSLAGRTGPEQARVGALSLGSQDRQQPEGGIAEAAEDGNE